jgi:hypothetical protein
MGTAFVIGVEMITEVCVECGIVFAITKTFISERQNDHTYLYCPKGHAQYYPDESELEKEKRKVRELAGRANKLELCCIEAQEETEKLERKVGYIKGGYRSQIARLKKAR